ncbi:(5-formylfuran-3-yl)methyl phosphate synthase [Sporomusa sphaeroides]|uniref:(5-formylfuran-3-yl)methyl phosphate synthase n=1 Tax=Sporomusa sphaeroides TaxID=47679 RepID=UPI00202DD274|nr:(5-formylfuran-3-yl)methyl phosphate synthase [Sporomusa sphaeroides]MCM0759202.1 (5-formylfuran-3-yl)methyl phosphate synthase [Sporomusa sphaeroides DSM 2875]HML35284.1 (5-formylfuran-3-yl)methyl phosphate synthase [Sporomusa sphaeroides]
MFVLIAGEKTAGRANTALLVSVVNQEEAVAAACGGADIIDIKNPAEGPLGAPQPGVIAAICKAMEKRHPVSVALGEFPEKPCAAALAAVGAAQFKPDFLKIAFAADTAGDMIVSTLREIRQGIRDGGKASIPLVAVAYADTLPASRWTLAEFTAFVRAGGGTGCLVDTQEKKGVSLVNILTKEELVSFIDNCRVHGLFSGLAGSLRLDDIIFLRTLTPDIIGVRSAVCGGDRLRGRVTSGQVQQLKALFSPAANYGNSAILPASCRLS